MQNLKKHLLTTLVASTLAMGSAQAADTVKIALAGPTTGSYVQYGYQQKVGATAAMDFINQAGGINGKKLEAVEYDDACDPKQAVQVANRIVNDGVQFVIGHLCSSSTEPASDIYEEEGILLISAASTQPSITEKGYQLVFRTIGLDNMQAPFAAKYILNHVKPKHLAIIHDKQQYGEDLAKTVRATVEAAGVKPVMYEGVTAGDKDFSALIAKLKKNDVDFVYYGGYHPELGLILRQARANGLKTQFMGPEGVGNPDISKIAGSASEGLLVTLPRTFDQDPANQKIVKAIQAKKQESSGPFIFTSYSAMQVLAEAMTATKSFDPEKVADYIHKNSFDTTTGKLEFDSKGDLKNFAFVVYQWHQDGSKTEVK